MRIDLRRFRSEPPERARARAVWPIFVGIRDAPSRKLGATTRIAGSTARVALRTRYPQRRAISKLRYRRGI